jgi:hypothetical protein
MLPKLKTGVKVKLLVNSINPDTLEQTKPAPKKSVILSVQELPRQFVGIILYGFGNIRFKSVPGKRDTFMSPVDPRNPKNILQIKIVEFISDERT